MKNSLFAPAPRRKRGLILTLSGSLLFHGSLIGVAAWWPTHPVVDGTSVISQVDLGDPAPPGDPVPAALPPSEPAPEPVPLKLADAVDNAPPTIEPNADDMSLATPMPRPTTRSASSHPAAVSAVPRHSHAQGSGPASAAAGSGPGVGRPGPAGHWITPKPAYPAALRMAHVQGSGSVRVTTDAAGRVVSATVVQSTGNARLDDNTCRAAKSEWSGPPNATISVPISYQLQ